MIIAVNFFMLPIVVFFSFQVSKNLLKCNNGDKRIIVTSKVAKIFLMYQWGYTTKTTVRLMGLIFHLLVTFVALVLTIPIVLFSCVIIVKAIFNFDFVWFSEVTLSNLGINVLFYLTIMRIIFEFANWIIRKRKR